MVLHYIDKGRGEPILFLHGMAASSNYWQTYISQLEQKRRLIAFDLLGFGRSRQSAEGYSVLDHCQAIKETLDHLRIDGPVMLVGHSMGALLALKFAVLYPEKVNKLVLLNMPIYLNQAQAKKNITRSKRHLRLAYYGPSSHLLCTTWCYLMRPLTKRLAPFYLPHLPAHVARDSVLHTWKAYSESLHNIIEIQSVEQDLSKLTIPAVLLYGNKEDEIVLNNASSLKKHKPNITIQFVPGTHNLPLEQSETIINLLVAGKKVGMDAA